MKLYQYAAVYHPKKDKDGNATPSEIIVQPTYVLARDEKSAGVLAARSIPEAYVDRIDLIEVLIRPFLISPPSTKAESKPMPSGIYDMITNQISAGESLNGTVDINRLRPMWTCTTANTAIGMPLSVSYNAASLLNQEKV